ncbi:MAG: hypothetical protein ACK4GJ_04280 [bacterium]
MDLLKIENVDVISMSKILFLSNGYGEDTIAYYIAKKFPEDLKNRIEFFPLVTEGKVFEEFKIVGPVKVFPSRGISGFLNFSNFLKDVREGLIKHIINQINFVKKIDKDYFFVAVGDIYPLLVLYFGGKINKTFFVATAKSIKTEFFNFFEISIMKKVIANFVRDEKTYVFLKKFLDNVYFLGNPVLDIPYFEYEGDISENNIIILPGRVNNCLDNLIKIKDSVKELVRLGFEFTVIVPNFYPVKDIKNLLDGIERIRIVDSIYYGFFLRNSFCVWGFGGSANEQAAGYGLPVISLNQKDWYRNRQKKLLGEALILVDEVEGFIEKTLKLKKDKVYYDFVSMRGKEEMGKL